MSLKSIAVQSCRIGQWTTFEVFSTGNGLIYLESHPFFGWYRGARAYRVRVKLKPPKFSLLKEMNHPTYRGVPIKSYRDIPMKDWMGPSGIG